MKTKYIIQDRQKKTAVRVPLSSLLSQTQELIEIEGECDLENREVIRLDFSELSLKTATKAKIENEHDLELLVRSACKPFFEAANFESKELVLFYLTGLDRVAEIEFMKAVMARVRYELYDVERDTALIFDITREESSAVVKAYFSLINSNEMRTPTTKTYLKYLILSVTIFCLGPKTIMRLKGSSVLGRIKNLFEKK